MILKITEGAVTGTEIIDPYFESVRSEFPNLLIKHLHARSDRTLGDLDRNKILRDIVLLHGREYYVSNITELEIKLREINGYRLTRKSRIDYSSNILAYAVNDERIEPVYDSYALHYIYEDTGRDNALNGVDPSGQCLKSADSAGKCSGNGLIIYGDIVFLKGLLKVLDDIVLHVIFVLHLAVKDFDITVIYAVYQVAGNLGPVEHHGDIVIVFVCNIDTCLYMDLKTAVMLSHCRIKLFELSYRSLFIEVCRDNGEMVASRASHDARIKYCSKIIS